jgi:hypothetical protein
MLVRVLAPTFTAGVVVEFGWVVHTAPILRWARGRTWEWFREKTYARGWKLEFYDDDDKPT